MIKFDLVKKVALKSEVPRDTCERVINDFLYCLNHALLDHKRVEIRNFGIFKVVKVASRIARDLNTDTPMVLPALWRIKFIPGKNIKEKLNA